MRGRNLGAGVRVSGVVSGWRCRRREGLRGGVVVYGAGESRGRGAVFQAATPWLARGPPRAGVAVSISIKE